MIWETNVRILIINIRRQLDKDVPLVDFRVDIPRAVYFMDPSTVSGGHVRRSFSIYSVWAVSWNVFNITGVKLTSLVVTDRICSKVKRSVMSL